MTNSTWTTTLGLVCLLLALASPGSACGDGHDDVKEWTKEELAELEAKWGFEVNQFPLRPTVLIA